MPYMPRIPPMPYMPGIPYMPYIPGIPYMPYMPRIPPMPYIPGIPYIPYMPRILLMPIPGIPYIPPMLGCQTQRPAAIPCMPPMPPVVWAATPSDIKADAMTARMAILNLCILTTLPCVSWVLLWSWDIGVPTPFSGSRSRHIGSQQRGVELRRVGPFFESWGPTRSQI